jgi:drug/metabolite transporter (DMT)-like permease
MLCAISLVWGASFLFIANGLESFKPASVGMLRVMLGAMSLSFIPAARATKIEREDRRRLALLALVWMAIPLTLFPIAEQWVSSALAGMLNGGMPILVALVSALLLRRAPGRPQMVGLAIGFVGIVLIGLPSLSGSRSGALGVGLIVIALCCYAIAANLQMPLTQKYGAIPVQLRVQGLASLFTAPLGLYGLRYAHLKTGPVLSVAALGFLGTGLTFVLAGRFLARVGATRGSIFTYVMPIVAIGLGVIFRHDHVKVLSIVGCGIVLVGAWVTSRAGR